VDTLSDQDLENVKKTGYVALVKLLKQSEVYENFVSNSVDKIRLCQSSLSNFATLAFVHLNHVVPESS